ncbi:hypothetical protein B484DRAFT_449000 [Ochromonadaceae sp. CCMP2298]|nr:hypothetical protein B484DRAFT_449000 [Ochromonadaceae sp. CCMP2298]
MGSLITLNFLARFVPGSPVSEISEVCEKFTSSSSCRGLLRFSAGNTATCAESAAELLLLASVSCLRMPTWPADLPFPLSCLSSWKDSSMSSARWVEPADTASVGISILPTMVLFLRGALGAALDTTVMGELGGAGGSVWEALLLSRVSVAA